MKQVQGINLMKKLVSFFRGIYSTEPCFGYVFYILRSGSQRERAAETPLCVEIRRLQSYTGRAPARGSTAFSSGLGAEGCCVFF